MDLIEDRQLKKIDSEMATHYLKYNNYGAQRQIRKAHVEELLIKMKKDLFRYGEVAFGSLNGDTYLMNGQHFLTALLKFDCPIDAVVEKYKCENKPQLSELFRQFENLPRSLTDMIFAEHEALGITTFPFWISQLIVAAASMEYLAGVNWQETKIAARGGVNIGSVSSRKVFGKDEKVALLNLNIPTAEWLARLFVGKDGKIVRNRVRPFAIKDIVFLMFKTNRVHIKDSEIFWNQVVWGENLTSEMPTYKLRQFYLTIPMRGQKGISPITSHEKICRGVHAWNAFRRNNPTELRYYPKGNIPRLH